LSRRRRRLRHRARARRAARRLRRAGRGGWRGAGLRAAGAARRRLPGPPRRGAPAGHGGCGARSL